MKPCVGELWEFTQLQRVRVGSDIATFRISGLALVLGVHLNGDEHGDYYEILWGEKCEEVIADSPWNFFGERIS
ncbi:MAG: hypothetical protein FJY85_00785 [Deltaproteobacteria bacterium]|nr:hypothetical protein [Deltaproteobacteria bacterium]